MRFSLALPNYARWFQPDAAAEIAHAAERLGYHGIYVNDHVAIPLHERDLFGNAYLDCFTLLGFLAAVTRQVRLGTSVIVVPYRNPVVQAKMIATLDVLSKGRITLGVGSGHVPEESAALSVPYADRGPMTDEYLRVMRTLWTEDVADFHGRWFDFAALCPMTRPVQSPLPILVGGHGTRAMRRVVEFGQGWNPMGDDPEGLARDIEQLQAMAEAAGRARPSVVLRWPLHLVERAEDAQPVQHRGEIQRSRRTPADAAERIAYFTAAGVDELIVDLPPGQAALLPQMEWFARELFTIAAARGRA